MNTADALQKLKPHYDRLAAIHMRDLFRDDPERFDKFSRSLGDLTLDFSRNRLDMQAFDALIELARDMDVENKRDAMFDGTAINTTENRSVLHTALRAGGRNPLLVDGVDIAREVARVLDRMRAFARDVRAGDCRVSGGKVASVVNIGIGGSDLGPKMATLALSPYADGPEMHFVSNVDGADLSDTVARLDPATTMFIIASKTFTTAETMANARSAREWIVAAVGEERAGGHFVALSTDLEATREFGIDSRRTFGFWDWVGGRYSIWSAIGLSLMIAIGPARFGEFLEGGHAVDEHFRQSPLEDNLPVILAMLGVWYRNIWDFRTHAVLPYDNRLSRFPAYLQQLDMESNGKRVTLEGEPVAWETAPVVWGEPGTNGQHAFYQLIHQGTDIVPCDFLIAIRPHELPGDQHRMLVANCLAQGAALMEGRTRREVERELRAAGADEEAVSRLAPHKVFEGNRPSNTIVYRKLTPRLMGMLIALYEHKVFVQGAVWDVNSFDQWGVELGKTLAVALEPFLSGTDDGGSWDASTRGLAQIYRRGQEL